MKYPAKTSFVLTKAEASLRHIEAAITAFEQKRFDLAITLAGAAEGMAPKGGLSLCLPYEFPRLSMTAVVTANDFDKRLELAITRSAAVRIEAPRLVSDVRLPPTKLRRI
jgi:hypothetical protein